MTLAYYGKSKQRRALLAIVALFAVALAISAAGAWKLSGADAASVTPVAFSGTNPTCGDVDNTLANGQTWLQVSTDTSPQTKAYPFPGVGTVNITVVAGNPLTFNWTSTFGIDAVIVKNGSVAHNVYVYATTTLASAESFGDNALQSLNNPGSISHVAFCYDPPLPTITKIASSARFHRPSHLVVRRSRTA